MHIELAYAAQRQVEDSEPLTVPQYWQKLGHRFSPAQLSLITPQDAQLDVCLLTGDAASGKTHAAVLLGIQLACERPMSVGLVTAPTQTELTHNVVEKYRQLLPQLGLITGQDYHLSQRQIRFANGSRIRFLSVNSPTIELMECQWIHAEHMHHLTETQFNRLLCQLRQPGCDGYINHLRFFGTGLNLAQWQASLFGEHNPYGFRHLTTQRQDNPSLPKWYVQWLQTRPLVEPVVEPVVKLVVEPVEKIIIEPMDEPAGLPACVSPDRQSGLPVLRQGLNQIKQDVLAHYSPPPK